VPAARQFAAGSHLQIDLSPKLTGHLRNDTCGRKVMQGRISGRRAA
jgi:hypothetical protein